MEYDEKSDTWDILAWIFIVLLVGIALGYAYRYAQEPLRYERGYSAGMEELSVVTRSVEDAVEIIGGTGVKHV